MFSDAYDPFTVVLTFLVGLLGIDPKWVTVIPALFGCAAWVAPFVPAPAEGSWLKVPYQVLNKLAGNWGHATNRQMGEGE